jgi:hypothetical protein
MRSMIISAKATLMVKCCTNQTRPGTSVTALSSACLKCSDTTGSEFVISSCAPCMPWQLSDKDQNAHDAPEITFTKAGAWAWRHLRNEKVRGSSPLSSTIFYGFNQVICSHGSSAEFPPYFSHVVPVCRRYGSRPKPAASEDGSRNAVYELSCRSACRS